MRRSIIAGAAAAVVTLAVLPGGAASAQARPAPARHAAKWLVTQQHKGLVTTQSSFGSFTDYGLSVDLGIALDTLGGHRKAVRKIRAAVAHGIDSYVGSGTEIYAGSTAKALYFAQATGAKGRHFGGVDLVKQLNGRVSTAKGIAGRISDKSAYGDYANTIGQAYAAASLTRAHSRKASRAVSFLLKQQCHPGFFRLNFAAVTSTAQTCAAGSRSLSAPDTDVTALTVIALESVHKPSRRIRKTIKRASRWLARHQKHNGSFGGGPSTKASNSNSTGLAAQALALTGRCSKAEHAAKWVRKLERHNGAIAYDKAAFTAARSNGITSATRDQWRRASTQAGPALRYVNGCK